MKAKPKKRNVRKSKNKISFAQKMKPFAIALGVVVVLFAIGYHYRNGLAYYLGFKSDKVNLEKQRISDVRNYQILTRYEANPVGIDVSEYQGAIRWDSVHVVDNTFPVRFVFVRATVGMDRPDLKFAENWQELKKYGYLKGAYHYYRPDENSTEQAALFIKNVVLQKGDFPPVLDIEQLPKKQTLAQLKVGLKNWLQLVEQHYGKKPILYSGERFYNDFLKNDFPEYIFWIANYNFFVENMKNEWSFWQFTEKASVSGIRGAVDVNIFNGTQAELQSLTIP